MIERLTYAGDFKTPTLKKRSIIVYNLCCYVATIIMLYKQVQGFSLGGRGLLCIRKLGSSSIRVRGRNQVQLPHYSFTNFWTFFACTAVPPEG